VHCDSCCCFRRVTGGEHPTTAMVWAIDNDKSPLHKLTTGQFALSPDCDS
jgi:hypothetical protein